MNTVFDLRKNNVITIGEESEDGVFLVIGYSKVKPKFNDFVINGTDTILVFDYVEEGDEPYQFQGRLLDTGMSINTLKTPSYRQLNRALLSQLRREK